MGGSARILLGSGLGLALFASLGGCQLAEPYLISRRSLALVTDLQPNMRELAQLPAQRESDGAPVLIDFRALNFSDEELGRLSAQPAQKYRMQAARPNPMFIAGGVVLGMALPHLALGLGVFLDKPAVSGSDGSGSVSDLAGGIVALSLAGLHLAAGTLLMVVGSRYPRIETASPQLLEQYTNPAAKSAPSATSVPAPQTDPPMRE